MTRLAQPSTREEQINEAIAAYLQAAERGERPDSREWLRRYPEVSDELGEFFADREQVGRLIAPLCPEPIRLLGPYELMEEIGRGGMGVVYKARQVTLNRVVVVKTIRGGEWATEVEVARFQAEAEAVASLDHPNIVPIYEVGESDGQHFFAMKFIEGGSLAQLLAEQRDHGSDGQRRSARLVATVARAVHYAHQRGILHRDLKPANVLLASPVGNALRGVPAGDDGTPRRAFPTDVAGDDRTPRRAFPTEVEPHVTDFGLAKRLGDRGQTQTGAIVGTPSYMAPEQAGGDKNLSTAADVYSLGAILYECLTGRPPFLADTPLETLLLVRNEEPVRPSAVQRSVDSDLETICLKCLHKEPSRRYFSAEALADDLDRWLTGIPIHARHSTAAERAVRWSRRHPALTILAAAAVLLVGLLVAYLGVRLDLAEADKRAANERADLLKQKSEQQARDQRLLTAHQALRNGMTEIESGEVGTGLLWLVTGLEAAPDEDLQRSFRRLLAGWGQSLHPLQRVFPVPPQTFPGLLLSPDGRTLARGGSEAVTCGKDDRKLDTIELWDISTGKRIGEPLKFPGDISRFSFSRDGKVLVAKMDEKATRYVDLTTRKFIPEPKDFAADDGMAGAPTVRFGKATLKVGDPLPVAGEGRVFAIRADAKRLVASVPGKDKEPDRLRLWDTETARPLGSAFDVGGAPLAAQCEERDVVTVAFVKQVTTGPDSTSLACVRKFDGTTGKRFTSQEAFPDVAYRGFSSASPDGRTAVLGGIDPRTRRLWDATSSRLLGAPIAQPNLQHEEFSPDSRVLFSHSEPGTGQFYDTRSGSPLGDRIDGGPGGIDWFSFTPDSRFLVTSGGADVRVWKVSPMTRGHVLRGNGFLFAPRFSPDGRHVLAENGGVRRWEVATGKPAGVVPDPRTGRQVAVTADGKRSLTVEQGRGLFCIARLYNDQGHPIGEAIRLPTTRERSWNEPSFSPDGRFVLGRDGRVARLWDSATGKRLDRTFDHGGEVLSAALSPDGAVLATGGADGLVRLWIAATGKPFGAPLRHKGSIETLRFSPDGARLLADENPPDRLRMQAWLWDVAAGKPIGEPIVHRGGIAGSPVFSPDGTRLLGGADRDTARQWDAWTGKPIAGLMYHGRQMDSFAYSPDSTVIATAGLTPYPDTGRYAVLGLDSARVRFWDAGTGRPIGPAVMLEKAGNSYVQFSADGRTLLAGNANELRLLPTPRPMAGDGERLRLWIEVSTGRTMDAGGALVRLDAAGWMERWKRLEAVGGAP